MNRQLTGRIVSFHFSPTELSKKNLLSEGISVEKITVIDALYHVVGQIKEKEELRQQLVKELEKTGYKRNQPEQNVRKLVLITGHRRENFGEDFIAICKAIKTLAMKYPEIDFVYLMHLNPNVRKH